MADPLKEETVDLITCCVCIHQYDQGQRKPKFLNCSHSACQQCLQILCKNGVITCPLCRKKSFCTGGVGKLANNNHALHMIKMQKTLTETMKKQIREPSWCFACGAVAKTTCYDNHNTVSIPMDKFTAGYELQKVVTNAKSKLEAVIQKRLELGTELGQILSELKSVEAKIQRKIMENESSLTKAMESLDVLSNKEKCNGNFHAIKEKMEKSIQDSDTQLKILTDLSAERQLERKIRMKIHLESGDQKIRTVPLFEDGFCLEDSNTTPNMAVISYLFISDLKRRNISLKISEENSYSNESI